MSQRYHDNTKRPKPKENQLGILNIYTFCWKILEIMRGNQKNNQQQSLIIFLKKNQFESLRKITVLGIFGPNLSSKWGSKSAENCKKHICGRFQDFWRDIN